MTPVLTCVCACGLRHHRQAQGWFLWWGTLTVTWEGLSMWELRSQSHFRIHETEEHPPSDSPFCMSNASCVLTTQANTSLQAPRKPEVPTDLHSTLYRTLRMVHYALMHLPMTLPLIAGGCPQKSAASARLVCTAHQLTQFRVSRSQARASPALSSWPCLPPLLALEPD